MMDIREKLVELLDEAGKSWEDYLFECIKNAEKTGNWDAPIELCEEFHADHLIRHGVTVQDVAYWDEVLDCGVGNCFGICSNCRTQQKAASYASLMTEYRHCRWCGARMVYQPPKGE